MNFFQEPLDPKEFRKIGTLTTNKDAVKYQHIPTGQFVLYIKCRHKDATCISYFLKTIKHLAPLQNMIQIYGEIEDESALVVEYGDRGSLRDIIDYRRKLLTEEQISIVLHDVLIALKQLHYGLFSHHYIQASHVIINSQGEIKLTEYWYIRINIDFKCCIHDTDVPLLYWHCPEEFLNLNKKNDIWSLACLAIELAEGAPPLAEYGLDTLNKEIKKNQFPGFRKRFKHSALFTNFVMKCSSVHTKYINCDMLLNDPFIKQAENLDRKEILKDLIENKPDFDEEEEEESFRENNINEKEKNKKDVDNEKEKDDDKDDDHKCEVVYDHDKRKFIFDESRFGSPSEIYEKLDVYYDYLISQKQEVEPTQDENKNEKDEEPEKTGYSCNIA